MQILSAPALILDVLDLHERDRIVSFLTAEWGLRRGVARSSRTKYSRFAGQLQALAKVEASWFEKEGRDLVRITDVALARPAAPLQEDLEGTLLLSYMAEHMRVFAQEGEASGTLFRLLDSTLEALLAGVDRQLAARYYEVWMLRLAGIFPVPRECPLCDRPYDGRAVLVESEGALVCRRCAAHGPRLVVAAAELEFLRRSGGENLRGLNDDPPPAPVLGRIEALCAKVRRGFLQAELKSYRVMRQTLDSLEGG